MSTTYHLFNYNLASWKKASVVYDSVTDEQGVKWYDRTSGRMHFSTPWGKCGAPILQGTVIIPQQQSMCHRNAEYVPDISHMRPFGSPCFVLRLPRHQQGAGKLSQSAHFHEAMREEVNAVFDMGVLEPVRAHIMKPIPTIMVYDDVKVKAIGGFDRYKARFVVKGFAQRPGLDFDDTWAPVSRLESVRSFLAAAAAEAIKEALWFKKLLPDLGAMNDEEAVHIILYDNLSAEAVLKTPKITEVSKHISRKCNFAKKRVALGEVQIEYVPTSRQVADILTKLLQRMKFELGRAALGVKAWDKLGSAIHA
ncbi:hypothetical protein CEUSTIGMA_g6297.t1 [Chlamydomonas eustigma]|uniref:Reverse transcriptase Ty1/copia-type domain-containing protein n=1 Tax=Chlamydomonas eustigma TaxID=1157962 RepID=A0A250X7G7_9CHLO|nr:hypothetical protein CEUSTIGMA_g6297.t1 [Chlamydomonas eustigma]|eukprot:GAX78859.1 hypothetical protein CEUSTIGMA_g6297.t1 [Chlamydomonas eustigma]